MATMLRGSAGKRWNGFPRPPGRCSIPACGKKGFIPGGSRPAAEKDGAADGDCPARPAAVPITRPPKEW